MIFFGLSLCGFPCLSLSVPDRLHLILLFFSIQSFPSLSSYSISFVDFAWLHDAVPHCFLLSFFALSHSVFLCSFKMERGKNISFYIDLLPRIDAYGFPSLLFSIFLCPNMLSISFCTCILYLELPFSALLLYLSLCCSFIFCFIWSTVIRIDR